MPVPDFGALLPEAAPNPNLPKGQKSPDRSVFTHVLHRWGGFHLKARPYKKTASLQMFYTDAVAEAQRTPSRQNFVTNCSNAVAFSIRQSVAFASRRVADVPKGAFSTYQPRCLRKT